MNVAIVTDSNSGIFEQEGKILGVHVIPMPVILEGKTLILSILVDTFISKISLPMQPVPEIGSISGA